MTTEADALPTTRSPGTPTPVRPSGSRTHIASIDGIRGLSAVYVVLFHMYQFATSQFVGVPPTWWKAFIVFNYGDCGVAVFIVVSGYCLMLPVAANEGAELTGGRRRFALRRLRRLGPGYAAALVGTMLLIVAVPALRHRSGTTWDASLPALSVGPVLAHLLLIHNWSRTWRFEIDTPMWTVALEAQIYAVFVFGLLPLWRRMLGRRPGTTVVAACAVVTAALMAAGLSWAQPWMLVLFALGMAAAAASQRSPGWLRGRIDVIVVAVASATALIVAGERTFLHTYDSVVFVREVAVGVTVAVFLVALRHASAQDGRLTRRLGAAFSLRPIVWLGQISYSLYLVHFPIIGVVALSWVYRRGMGVPANFAAIVLVGGGISIIVATVFHRLFERPYLARRQVAPTLA